MNFTPADAGPSPLSPRLPWEKPVACLFRAGGMLSSASLRLVHDVRDDHGFPLPLREELRVSLLPPRGDGLWRATAEQVGPGVVGRGRTAGLAIRDWRKRLVATFARFLELRPFEFTPEDRDLFARLESVIDFPLYRATKPMVVRQVGTVAKRRGAVAVVAWEDGRREKVKVRAFDDAFSRFAVGQTFEASVTRDPITFRLIRADALRRLPVITSAEAESRELWDRIVGDVKPEPLPDLDENFWLKPAE